MAISLEHLRFPVTLEEVVLSNCNDSESMIDQDLVAFSCCPNIRRFTLMDAFHISSVGLQMLQFFAKIEYLSLEELSEFNDDSVKRIEPLKNLRTLILSGLYAATLQGTGFQILNHTNLLSLDLHTSTEASDDQLNITDKGIFASPFSSKTMLIQFVPALHLLQ